MQRFLAVGLLLICSCTSQEESAEQRYKMVRDSGGTAMEVCLEGQKVVEAYLAAGNAREYEDKKVAMAIECQHAELFNPNGLPVDANGAVIGDEAADTMDKLPDNTVVPASPHVLLKHDSADPCRKAGPKC